MKRLIEAFNKLKCKVKINCCCNSECVKKKLIIIYEEN